MADSTEQPSTAESSRGRQRKRPSKRRQQEQENEKEQSSHEESQADENAPPAQRPANKRSKANILSSKGRSSNYTADIDQQSANNELQGGPVVVFERGRSVNAAERGKFDLSSNVNATPPSSQNLTTVTQNPLANDRYDIGMYQAALHQELSARKALPPKTQPSTSFAQGRPHGSASKVPPMGVFDARPTPSSRYPPNCFDGNASSMTGRRGVAGLGQVNVAMPSVQRQGFVPPLDPTIRCATPRNWQSNMHSGTPFAPASNDLRFHSYNSFGVPAYQTGNSQQDNSLIQNLHGFSDVRPPRNRRYQPRYPPPIGSSDRSGGQGFLSNNNLYNNPQVHAQNFSNFSGGQGFQGNNGRYNNSHVHAHDFSNFSGGQGFQGNNGNYYNPHVNPQSFADFPGGQSFQGNNGYINPQGLQSFSNAPSFSVDNPQVSQTQGFSGPSSGVGFSSGNSQVDNHQSTQDVSSVSGSSFEKSQVAIRQATQDLSSVADFLFENSQVDNSETQNALGEDIQLSPALSAAAGSPNETEPFPEYIEMMEFPEEEATVFSNIPDGSQSMGQQTVQYSSGNIGTPGSFGLAGDHLELHEDSSQNFTPPDSVNTIFPDDQGQLLVVPAVPTFALPELPRRQPSGAQKEVTLRGGAAPVSQPKQVIPPLTLAIQEQLRSIAKFRAAEVEGVMFALCKHAGTNTFEVDPLMEVLGELLAHAHDWRKRFHRVMARSDKIDVLIDESTGTGFSSTVSGYRVKKEWL